MYNFGTAAFNQMEHFLDGLCIILCTFPQKLSLTYLTALQTLESPLKYKVLQLFKKKTLVVQNGFIPTDLPPFNKG